MAVNGTHNTGEEFKQKAIFRSDLLTRPASIDVGLYNDGTDSLTEASDVTDITTEPGTGNYGRQTLSLDSGDISISSSSGDIQVSGSVTFDTADTGETIDGYFLVVNFQSDVVNNESSANDHLLTSATFGDTDLTNFIDLTVTVNDTLS